MDAKPIIDIDKKVSGKVEESKPKAGIDKEMKDKMSKIDYII